MKNFAILLLILFYQTTSYSQAEKYSFNVEIIGTGKPILIGHSLGGFLSLSIASSQSALLKSIIIVDSYPFMSLAYNPSATVENVLPQAKTMKEMLLAASDSLFIQQQKMTMPTMITENFII